MRPFGAKGRLVSLQIFLMRSMSWVQDNSSTLKSLPRDLTAVRPLGDIRFRGIEVFECDMPNQAVPANVNCVRETHGPKGANGAGGLPKIDHVAILQVGIVVVPLGLVSCHQYRQHGLVFVPSPIKLLCPRDQVLGRVRELEWAARDSVGDPANPQVVGGDQLEQRGVGDCPIVTPNGVQFMSDSMSF